MHPKTKFKLMSLLDHWLGVPICIILGMLAKFLSLFKSKQREDFPRNILILKWFGMGSILLMEPLMRQIRNQNPKARIIFLTFAKNKALLQLMGNCDEIRCINSQNIIFFVFDTMKQLIKLAGSNIDVAIDLEFFSKFSTMMVFFSGARKRIGFYLPYFWRKAILTDHILFNYYKHITEIYRAFARNINIDYEDLSPRKISISDEAKDHVHSLLIQKGWNSSDRLVGINVNAGELAYSRRWPADYFVELINTVVSKGNLRIVLVGSAEESDYTNKVFNNLEQAVKKQVINLAGQLNLSQFIVLINLFSLFVTNDSGPLHLAYAQGINTVSMWGPGSPALYGIKKEGNKSFYLGLDCSPCMYIYRSDAGFFCKNKIPCLTGIKPQEIADYVFSSLQA